MLVFTASNVKCSEERKNRGSARLLLGKDYGAPWESEARQMSYLIDKTHNRLLETGSQPAPTPAE